MNKYVHSEIEQHTMILKQMGADVKTISSKMVYVTFPITDRITVSYVFNVNRRNKYFVERIKPYPIVVKEFDTPQDVIDIIKIDVDQFRNAVQSHNIFDFIQINQNLHQTILKFEDLFLYYNVKGEHIKVIEDSIQKIMDEIEKAHATSERVYFEKEPEHFKD